MSRFHAPSLLALVSILLGCALLLACSEEKDSGDPIDGDAEEETLPDGDESDAPAETEALEDSEEESSEIDDSVCTAQEGTLCFKVLSGPYAKEQAYFYIPNEIASLSECKIDEDSYSLTMYEDPNSQTSFRVDVLEYSGLGEYALPVSSGRPLAVQWSIVDGATTRNFNSKYPCTVKVVEETHGSFDCSMQDPAEASVYFRVVGAWSCPAAR